MIPRTHRLPRYGFARMSVLPRSSTDHLTLFLEESGPAHGVGVIVPKKVAKKATDRNRLKRQLRALASPHVTPERTLIVLARTGAGTCTYSTLASEFDTLLSKVTRQRSSR